MRPSAARRANSFSKQSSHVAVDRAVDLADLGVARRFKPDLEAHGALVGGLLDEVVLAELGRAPS